MGLRKSSGLDHPLLCSRELFRMLKRDLIKQLKEACRIIDIYVPVYACEKWMKKTMGLLKEAEHG